ncbi:MAG TPA: WhiB family transcriptional regulator, partial [Ilumatobacteraceae bacterium]|nr:WhiB family transcriptional regulator [Ilumatobacteraceae bacterium]
MTLTDSPTITRTVTPVNDTEQDHLMYDPSLSEPGSSTLLEPREPDSPRPPGEEPVRRAVARCADGHGTLSALFFSDNVIDIARAKAMCGLCPLQVECLAGALEREE